MGTNGGHPHSVAVPANPKRSARGLFAWALCCALAAALIVYWPALSGDFVFDDLTFPFAAANQTGPNVIDWISGLRPVLFCTYWLNYTMFGDRPGNYHFTNILIHAFNASLVFFIFRRLLAQHPAGALRNSVLAAFGAALFLLHPLQTESVAYIASRSETLAAFFMLLAILVFVRQPPGSTLEWRTSLSILSLFALACGAKEHAVALVPALFTLDYLSKPASAIRIFARRWKLYVPVAAGSIVAVGFVFRILASAPTAGFNVREFTWQQYWYTECRVVFLYLRLFLLPFRQTVDYDIPVSRTILDHGSLLALIGIAAIVSAAFWCRRKYPLACAGAALFLILLAPTSSFVPLQDPVAEHRMYLGVFALLLVVLEAVRRVRISPRHAYVAGAAAIAIASAFTYSRNVLWGNTAELWKDTIAKSPNKPRAYQNLAAVYLRDRRCAEAAGVLREGVSRSRTQQPYLLAAWADAEACQDRFEAAAALLEKAIALKPDSHLHVRLGITLAKMGKTDPSLAAFQRAAELDPASDEPYLYRGLWFEAVGRFPEAESDYRMALARNPGNRKAEALLRSLQERIRRETARIN